MIRHDKAKGWITGGQRPPIGAEGSAQSCEKVTLLHQRIFRTPKNLHQKCVNRDTFIIAKSYKLPKKALLYS